MAAKAVKVLHRAVDSDDEGSGRSSQPGSPQHTLQELQAANQSLKQRLEQVGTRRGQCVCLQLGAYCPARWYCEPCWDPLQIGRMWRQLERGVSRPA